MSEVLEGDLWKQDAALLGLHGNGMPKLRGEVQESRSARLLSEVQEQEGV
jgi:hypothetical protein